MHLSNWKLPNKRTNEDNMLVKYWEKVGGIIFTEVFVGKGGIQKWAGNAKQRRIDGVQIISSRKINGLYNFQQEAKYSRVLKKFIEWSSQGNRSQTCA